MTDPAVREAVLAALHRIAPEADLAVLRPDGALRDQLDLDSVDFLGFVVGLHDALRVDVPEADYGKLRTLDDCVRYLEARLHGGTRP